MSKIEEWNMRAAESLAAAESASNERERSHHRRAYGVWRKLIAGVGEAEARAAMKPAPKIQPLKPASNARH